MSPGTYSEAQIALNHFLPKAGEVYARERNFDNGPGENTHVSGLSPAVQRRVLSEKEVITAVLKQHPWEQSEKFVQEVLWRSYWKSWLELRPSVWRDYRNQVENSQSLSLHYSNALAATTGISCFDEWRKELKETGYLHNHSRMWFASIWIFTLELPWFLGAKLFENELLDFDAASNTLSWRWVAGLHTQGKHYLATAENIKKFTRGRFYPKGQLNENACSGVFQLSPVEKQDFTKAEKAQKPLKKIGLLMHSEDLSLERTEAVEWGIEHAAFFDFKKDSQTPLVTAYEKKAIEDALKRWPRQKVPVIQNLKDWMNEKKLEGIILIKPWQGPLKDALESPLLELKKEGYEVRLMQREYDCFFEGKARSGFFSFKEAIKPLLNEILAGGGKEALFYVNN